MNTEPVKTTMRGLEASITGGATVVTATAALTSAVLLLVSQLLIQFGMGEIPLAIQAQIVTVLTVGVAWWEVVKAKGKIREASVELREEVTPWHPSVGAMTPAPSEPVDANFAGENLAG